MPRDRSPARIRKTLEHVQPLRDHPQNILLPKQPDLMFDPARRLRPVDTRNPAATDGVDASASRTTGTTRANLPCVIGIAFVVGAQAAAAADRTDTTTIVVRDCRVLFTERRTLSSERLGVIEDIVAEGGLVAAGEKVIQLEDAIPRAALAVAESRVASDVTVRSAEKRAEAAHAEHKIRLKANENTTLGKPIYPESEVLRRRLDAEAADLDVETALHELAVFESQRDQAQADVNAYQRASPIDGLVTRVYRKPGETVQQSEPLLEVVNTRKVRIEGFVPVEQVFALQRGQPVTVRLDVPEADPAVELTEFRGTLDFIDVSVQPISRTVRVWADVENRDDILRDGLTAEMVVDVSFDPQIETIDRQSPNGE